LIGEDEELIGYLAGFNYNEKKKYIVTWLVGDPAFDS
jgi:hypothetical protein